MAKRRSRRLRKKLRVGEFREFGFAVDVRFKDELSPEAADAFLDALLTQAIEPRGLMYGGGTRGGFIAHMGRGSVTPAERDAVLAWFRGREEVRDVNATELVDSWYGVEETESAENAL